MYVNGHFNEQINEKSRLVDFFSCLRICVQSLLFVVFVLVSVCTQFWSFRFDLGKSSSNHYVCIFQTQGLLGTLDGEVSNDFKTPTGGIIPIDSSEDKVYLDFSLKCKLSSYTHLGM